MNGAPAPRRRRRFRATPGALGTALAAAAMVAALAGCDPYVQGNGVFHQEDRSSGLPPFEGIHVEDRIAVVATEMSGVGGPQTVVVSGDANVVRGPLKTEVRQETVGEVPVAVLHVFVDQRDFSSEYPLRAVVGVRGLRFVRAREEARVEAFDVSAGSFVVDAAGGADVTVRAPGDADGAGRTLDVAADAAFVRAAVYPVETAHVALSGGSRVELRAGEVSGTADAQSRIDNFGGGLCDVPGTALLCCGPRESCP